MSMFCYQCQETSKGTGCEVIGVCGKTPEVSDIQDLLLFVNKGVAIVNDRLRKEGKASPVADKFVIDAMFMSITNANFDDAALTKKVEGVLKLKKDLVEIAKQNGITLPNIDEISFDVKPEEFDTVAIKIGVLAEANEDIRSLKQLMVYGLKGLAAYAEHALNLGFEQEEIYKDMEDAFYLIATSNDINALVSGVLAVGNSGVKGMALLDKANTTTYGNPEITKVNLGVRNNPAILVSGHDLRDLEDLLEQTKGTGVDVYTHSEMLPAHYYPSFKKYDNFVGNYGNAWWKQKEEFESFNGPILMTTNCIVPPRSEEIRKRIFTSGASGYPGCPHITADENGKKDFSEIITMAKQCKPPVEIETGSIVGGFAHNQVFALADKVVEVFRHGRL